MNDDMLPPAHPLEIDDVEMDSESILDLREETHRGATPGEMLVKKFVKDDVPGKTILTFDIDDIPPKDFLSLCYNWCQSLQSSDGRPVMIRRRMITRRLALPMFFVPLRLIHLCLTASSARNPFSWRL
jgi:hypothetical protein